MNIEKNVFNYSNEVEIKAALHQAKEYYHDIDLSKISQRAKLLLQFASALEQNKDMLAKSEMIALKTTYQKALDEIEIATQIAEYYALNAKELFNVYLKELHGFKEQGLVVIRSQNVLPYAKLVGVLAPNYLLGNPIILTPSPKLVGIFNNIEEMTYKANFQAGAFKNLFINQDAMLNLKQISTQNINI